MSPVTLRTQDSYELFPDEPDMKEQVDAPPARSGESRVHGENSAGAIKIADERVIKIDRHNVRTARSHTSRTRMETSRKSIGGMVSNGSIGRRLLNVREAAQYLDLEVDTVYKKSRLREVPSVKVGRALKFDVEALNRYIEQHTIETID
jgi:excisionase family DNA binding protein